MTAQPSTLIIAMATIDGESMPKGHFGEAPRFDFYQVDRNHAVFLLLAARPV